MRKLIFSLLLLPFLAMAQEVVDDAYFDISAQGGAEYNCRVDGAPVSGAHNQEYTATERISNLLASNPGSIVACEARKVLVGRLTSKGMAVFAPSEPDPVDPDPVDPDPVDPDPIDPDPIDPDPVDPDPVDPSGDPTSPNYVYNAPQSWSGYRGIPNPSDALGFDVYGDYSVDRVITGNLAEITINESGTPTDPYVVDASAATARKLSVNGNYVIIQGGTIRTTGEGPVRSQGHHVVFRDIDVGGNNTNHSHGSAVGLRDFNVWIRGAIHNFGVLGADAPEQDQHGFKVIAEDVWILDVETYELSGDGVQVGDASRGVGNRIYIGGGYYHDNRENAVDIKDSTDTVTSGVIMSNFFSVGSSNGEAIVIHDDARNALVYDNYIRNAALGIVSSGASSNANHIIEGNDIQATKIGLDIRSTRPIDVRGNTVDAPQESRCGGGLDTSRIQGC